jgi:hypothetical protein
MNEEILTCLTQLQSDIESFRKKQHQKENPYPAYLPIKKCVDRLVVLDRVYPNDLLPFLVVGLSGRKMVEFKRSMRKPGIDHQSVDELESMLRSITQIKIKPAPAVILPGGI